MPPRAGLPRPRAGLPSRAEPIALLLFRFRPDGVRGTPCSRKDFSDLYEQMSGKGASASEAHRLVCLHLQDALDESGLRSVALQRFLDLTCSSRVRYRERARERERERQSERERARERERERPFTRLSRRRTGTAHAASLACRGQTGGLRCALRCCGLGERRRAQRALCWRAACSPLLCLSLCAGVSHGLRAPLCRLGVLQHI